MPDSYFAIGATLASMVNLETLISTPPTVLPEFGGLPMPLTGGVARRALSRRLRRSGDAKGAWAWTALDNDFTDLYNLILALTGALTTASRERYITTVDATGRWSPFLCYVDAPYPGESLDYELNEHVRNIKVDLTGGVLQSATKSANATITTSERLVYVDTSEASRTMTLPPVSGIPTYTLYSFEKTSAANSMILDGNASETIDGALTKTVTALYGRADLYSTGSAWVSVS